ncbi:nitrous oxide reductase accessory protein NosL [Sandaracinus amylolyticus]|uniref:NosL-related protein n=1 Tax=Sandaracinus amylolyticus TaxID=927083 RepID=A0A0F6W7P8_9BACT|nr:nitrous oxide reductase accessory protein NosL [Sandaracinus amylolyticus]AKF09618.1 nosL-related protein [Sandaracinus amylolyticus]
MHRANVLTRLVLTASMVLAVLAACASGDTGASAQAAGRCAHCGMRVPADSTWRAGLTTASGEALLFDAPKCMFRILRGERGRDAREPWVIEYYASERRPASSLVYVLGSDVESPMGRDLVPIEGRERAERFQRDHHAQRVLTYDEVTSSVIDELFRPGGGHAH